MKKLVIIICIFLTLCIGVSFSRADFGDFAGDNDYDYGGYDDYGYDDDDDYGYDYGGYYDDDDYGGTGYGGTNSHATVGDTLFILGLIAVLVLIAFLRAGKRKTTGGVYTNRRIYAPAQRPADPNINNGRHTPPREQTDCALTSVNAYKEKDPGFNEKAIKEKLGNLYMQLQTCWTAGNIEPLRPYLTDALYNTSQMQLNNLRSLGRTNYVERIAVLDCVIRGFSQDGSTDFMHVLLRTRIVDYTVDAEGNVVSGSKTAEKFMTYEWTLSRKSGVQTSEASGTRTVSCPHCGAPLDVNASAKCEYCGSVITVDNEDWVISSIRGISQTTR